MCDKLRVAVLPLALLALTGCARSVVTTEIHKDGSWKRTLKLYGAAPSKGQDQMGQTLDSAFVLPQGPEWKTTRTLEKSEKAGKDQGAGMGNLGQTEVFTAERTLAPGETLSKDIALKSSDTKAKEPVVVNSVSVHQIGAGRYEYREVLHWQGPPIQKALSSEMPDLTTTLPAEVKKLLPEDLATPAKLEGLQQNLLKGIWREMFGPNDPLITDFFQLAFFPDAAERKMARRFHHAFSDALAATYGDALPAEKRVAITRLLTQTQFESLKSQATEKAAAGPPVPKGQGDQDGSMVSMTFIVHFPGHIVETNGETDPVTDDVYWTLYSPSMAVGDVQMRAVCDVNQ